MKKLIFTCLLSVMFLTIINAQYGVERTGYEGDYFSLEGAIELFKESRSINNFERRLNDEDSWVNNLDLNYDGNIDYIRVEHRNQGDFHAIILQAILGRRDVQDVAVIEIERTGRRTAVLQIIGDADLYGEEVIAEPYKSEGYSSRGDYDFNRGYVNVFHWRVVQRILDRSYVTYVSPYRWNYYPTYWRSWRQHGWSVYHPRRVRYYNHCHIVYIHRVIHVHNFYRPHRAHSSHFAKRARKHRKTYGSSVAHRSHGKKNKTYRTSTRGKKGSRVASQYSNNGRNVASNGRGRTASTKNNNKSNSREQNRDFNSRSKTSTSSNRSRGNDNVAINNSGKSRVQNDRNRGGTKVPRKENSRSNAQLSKRSAPKQSTVRSSQNRVSKPQNRSQTRSTPVQTQRKTQTRSTQSRTQPRASQNRKQNSNVGSSRKSPSTKKSASPRKSATSKSSSTSNRKNSSSGRKGRG